MRRAVLTEAAAEVAREELSTRGVDPERIFADAPPPEARRRTLIIGLAPVRSALIRIVRFPLRAVLGVESPLAVLLGGGALAFLAFRFTIWAAVQLYMIRPTPPYALPLGYAAIAVYALVIVWLAVALWRTGARVKARVWRLFLRAAAVVCALHGVLGTFNGAQLMKAEFAGTPQSVMDAPNSK